jgi:hypothetical protein
MSTTTAANRWRRHGHRPWTIIVIVVMLTTEEDVTMLGNEDW